MNPAVLSLMALLVAIGLSMATRLNVGVLALAFAWLIGTYVAGWRVEQVAAGFPSSLFLTLTGVTLLFALAEANGTLERLAQRAVGLARGRTRLIPVLLFLIAFALSSVGPGAITTVALLIPMAMAIATRAGVPRFLTALAVANGANAGNLSPISAIGIIANTKMAEAGVGGHEGKVWLVNFAAHLLVTAGAYVVLGGWRLAPARGGNDEGAPPFERRHRITTAIVGAWVAGVVGFQLSVGLAAFLAASLLVLLSLADETAAMKRIPWGVIVMVCGVTVLISVLEKTGGMELFTAMLARLASPVTINGVVAFVTGLISSWSSTAGVVLPAFLPTVPGLVEKVGGGDPLAVALSINVGSAMVDVSPLSTLGALCVAAVADPVEARELFRKLLVWGLSMSVVAAALCQLLAGVTARY
ncbi:MAG: C4-dicarboxylate ABC transporter [Gemmatimonadaceae bacterium]|nr:C4-dicarboxylate ABC transporter [Gemmatimonadaceae bacterium]